MAFSTPTDAPSLPSHSGQPRSGSPEFFADTPPEIGPPISADSTLGVGLSPAVRGMLWLLVVAAIAGGFWLASLQQPFRNRPTTVTLGIVIAGAVAIVGLCIELIRKYYCTYVAPDGIARFTVRKRGGTPKQEILLFAGAEELKAHQVRHFHNGIYSGTTYDYAWFSPEGKKLFRCRGRYMGKKKPPKPRDIFHFANAADVAWSKSYLLRAQKVLETEGSIPFRVDKKRWIRIGPGFMEFHFGDEPIRVTKEEIDSVKLGGGTFSFKHNDAKWYSRQGKYSFSYGTMANAKVFLLAMEKLMGYRWN